MSIYQGTYFGQTFIMKTSAGAVVDVSAWTFNCEIRAQAGSPTILATLTLGNAGIIMSDGPNGKFSISLSAVQTALLPTGKVVFDVLRTDAVPGPIWLFGGVLRVKQPVTR